MNITIKIPDEKKNAIVGAFADLYGYAETIKNEKGESIQNPQTKTQFVKKKIRDFIVGVYTGHKVREADSARIAALATAKEFTENIIID